MRYSEITPKPTPQFLAWFKNSKVVSARGGAPLVVYHGTTKNFDRFEPVDGSGHGQHAQAFGPGYYFTDLPARAAPYATKKTGANMMPCYLSLQNPKIYAIEQRYFLDIGVNGFYGSNEKRAAMTAKLKSEGYDGIIVYRTELPGNSSEYIAFYPNQIKSVFSAGFDSESDHLSESTGSKLYHGTRKDFPIGFILKAQPDGYAYGGGEEGAERLARMWTEQALEDARRRRGVARQDAVYMCAKIDEIDRAGGYEDFIYEVEPIGPVTKANLFWYGSLESYCFHMAAEGEEPDGQDLRTMAANYWNCAPNDIGETHRDLIEYLAGSARIVARVNT
jgi:hypothetical protein